MKIENLSLAEIVISKPEAAALLEMCNLDFCCGGKRKLSEVLFNDQPKLDEVKSKLEKLFEKETTPKTDFNKFSLIQLVDYILENHHRYVRENLPVIQHHIEQVSLKHGDAYPEMKKMEILFDELKRDFEQHMMKEEVILFPRIEKLEELAKERNPSGENFSLQTHVDVMEYEHEIAGKLMREIKKLSNNYTPPSNACTTFRVCLDELKIFENDLHQHVHLENNILFPKALKLQNNLNRTSCSCSL